MAWSPDSTRIAVTENNRVQVFEVPAVEVRRVSNWFEFGRFGSIGNETLYNPSGVAWSPDGDRIAIADSRNNRIQVIDAHTGEFVFNFGREGGADELIYSPGAIDYSPDGAHIAVGFLTNPSCCSGHPYSVGVFDADTGDYVSTLGSGHFRDTAEKSLYGPVGISYSPLP